MTYSVIDPSTLPEVLTLKEVASLCRVSPKTARNWTYIGNGPQPVVKIGGRLMFFRQSVLDFLLTGVRVEGGE